MQNHLATLYRVFIDEILAGRKQVECRFGKMGYSPLGQVRQGDLIWLKQVGGPIRAVAKAQSVREFENVTEHTIQLIRRRWNQKILAPDSFWFSHRHASAVMLIWLGDVCALKPFTVLKRDRRAWVVLNGPPIPGQPLACG